MSETIKTTDSKISALSALLAESGVIVVDGAQGTELERHGVQLGASKLWSAQLLIDDPDLVRAIHLDYLRAGSDIITTFTYQASIQGLAEVGVDATTAAALLNRAVDLAHSAREAFLQEQQLQNNPKEVAPEREHQQESGTPLSLSAVTATSGGRGTSPGANVTETDGSSSAAATASDVARVAIQRRWRPLVAFSCGSYGAYLADGSEFHGSYVETMSVQQLYDFHRARLEPVRNRTEIDLLAFETLPCLREAEVIVDLLRREQYGKPSWISFSCRDGFHTCHGEHFAEQCVPLLAAAAAEGLVAAVGINCTAPRHVSSLLTAAREQLVASSTASSGRLSPLTAAPQRHQTQPQLQPPVTLPPPQSSPQLDHFRQQQQQQQDHQQQLLLLCYPNSGEEWDGKHRCWRHVPDDIAEPEQFAEAAAEWVYGTPQLELIGGCCRTGPEHIRALRQRLHRGRRAVAAAVAVPVTAAQQVNPDLAAVTSVVTAAGGSVTSPASTLLA
ncbi:hypothetical protein VaNZ11_001952 [Volvox africanus]|uniref:Hcy-binding domain-containing protein n=1 Tax=Volvox africanus TaxID=51714 RepID=A0ABQ5RR33_9CHLO|nr:hypothetical protein VaNZ11_001952 [Volvox africanus]